ncbi:hypothetical protein RB195_013915 [Necator americanus]|uniref:RING-type E3 ubiquitin transferase n=1 Tax=Necator americanus TaxID=51031 RepID=A0ABR1DXT4_NECAM
MSDFTVRSRRRVEDKAPVSTFDDHDTKKESASVSSSIFGSYHSLSDTVFGASPAQLWNSAQEAFSSIPSPLYPLENSGPKEFTEKDFPVLSIFGDPIDFFTFTMPSRDRTTEFRTTCKSLQMKVHSNGFVPQTKKEILGESVQFNQLAKRIGRDLSQTCAKMERLAELAKKKSLFDERSDMDHLSRIVKEDITGLNKQIAALQEFSRRRSGGTKNQGTGHTQLVVVGLQSKLATVSKDFQSVLEISTENLKHQKSRREKFSHADHVPLSLPSSSSGSNVRSRLLEDDNQHGVPRVNSVTLDMGAMEQMRVQQQMTLQDQSDTYVQARSDAMETIEGSISELGQIFAQLASLVSEQGEMITRIDSNVEDTAINIDAAHTELEKFKVKDILSYWNGIASSLMRISPGLLAVASFVATAATVTNAFVVNKQFYPSIVYITKSNASMMVIYVQALILVYVLFQIVRKIFFGELRASEAEHLSERAWHAVLETCLAFTVFRDDFSPLFVMQFVGLLFVKSFHWLADDRVDMMERSPVITLKFHLRMMCIVAFLGATDSYLVSHAYFTTLLKGASAQIVFGFEYAILMALVIHVTIKYILHMHDLRTAQAWENKAVYLLYAELLINLIRCVLYGLFAAVMLRVHSFPLFSVRPFYLSLRALHKAINDVILSRRAINAMNNLFPIVTTEDLSAMDATCIICRDEMTPESAPKRLPCGHVFHTHCLRSWFQRQQTCPTCRTDILAAAGQRPTVNGAVPAAQPNNAAAVANGMGNPRLPPNLFPFMAHQFAVPQPRPPAQDNAAPAGAFGQEGNAQPAAFPFSQHLPPFPFIPPLPPFPMEMPRPPRVLNQLSEEELRALEGQSRAALEGRIKMLGDISTLLDAAVAQMQQYTAIFGAAPLPVPMPTSMPNSAWQTLFGLNTIQHNSDSELDVTQSTSAQDVTGAQPEVTQSEQSVELNGTNKKASPVDGPSTSKSLFGQSVGASPPSTLLSSVTVPEEGVLPDTPSSSKEAAKRSPSSADEEVRQRRLKRFGASSEDR